MTSAGRTEPGCVGASSCGGYVTPSSLLIESSSAGVKA